MPTHCGRFSLGIYAPNGERIRDLAEDEQDCDEDGDEDFRVTRDVFCPREGQSASFLVGGKAYAWDGRGQTGDWVQSGLYWVKLELRDSAGRVSSLTYGLTVLDSPRRLELNIFDSAGELVRAFELEAYAQRVGLGPLGVDVSALALGPGSGAAFHFDFAGLPGPTWDGRGRSGAQVDPGVYLVQLLQRGPSSPLLLSSLQLTVLAAPGELLAGAFAAPNPAPRGGLLRVFAPAASGASLSASLHDLQGRSVLEVSAPAGEGRLDLELGGRSLAPGLYILRLNAFGPGGRAQGRLLKVALEP